MPNMSYCRFRNTEIQLQDCLDNLFDSNLSEEEDAARSQLIKICQDIIFEVGDELEEKGTL